ncbi:SLC13 family permease [Thermodesulfobacteriota bacterium]
MSEERRNDGAGRSGRGGLPPMADDIFLAPESRRIDWKRICFLLLGVALFSAVVISPPWSAAVDPAGKQVLLTAEGKAAIGLFLLTAVWWVFEVIPIGVTAILVGVTQALFHIRTPRVVFTDFMDPSVWFIFGSIVIGLVFTKTGLTKRLAYKMLLLVGEKTSMIYLGCFLMTAFFTHIMAHTAVAATVFPLLMAVYSLYEEDETKPTRFGKGLFIGMAFVAGAGSIITLLGAARGAVAIGFYNQIVGREIDFFELTFYMAPVGWLMVFLLWGLMMVMMKPERKTIPGLRERARSLHAKLGPVSANEIIVVVIVFGAIAVMSLRSLFGDIEFLQKLDKSAVILVSTVLFFVLKILDIDDLEKIPWNIILLFGGAMSLGFCLWQTGAAEWMAVKFIVTFKEAPWFVFVLAIAFFVLIMTNLIMNVAAIAISLPVALVLAGYMGVAPEVILYASLVAAGMPFLFLVGAAPNAIAYSSGQFTSGEFFKVGIPASLILLVVIGLFILVVWPLMEMPILIQ